MSSCHHHQRKFMFMVQKSKEITSKIYGILNFALIFSSLIIFIYALPIWIKQNIQKSSHNSYSNEPQISFQENLCPYNNNYMRKVNWWTENPFIVNFSSYIYFFVIFLLLRKMSFLYFMLTHNICGFKDK